MVLWNDVVVDGNTFFDVGPFFAGPNIRNVGRYMLLFDGGLTDETILFIYGFKGEHVT